MNYLDLFHGIGGFALGAYWAGMKFEHHYCSDIEPWCQELYAKRFPDSIQLGDITKIDAKDLPAGDWIITGGFPCQDISIAGKGAGIHGERSGLWFEYWRLIRDLRPRFAIMENVGMLVHRGLREVLGSLAEIGYDAEWQDIRASDVGAPHRRERIWIVAYARNTRDNRFGMRINRERAKKNTERIKGIKFSEKGQTVAHAQSERCGETGTDCERSQERITDGGDVPDATSDGLERKKPERKSWEHNGLFTKRCCELSNTKNAGAMRRERPQKNADGQIRERGRDGNFQWWSTEPDVGRVAHGIPARVDRLKCLGNAVVPQQAYPIFRALKEIIFDGMEEDTL